MGVALMPQRTEFWTVPEVMAYLRLGRTTVYTQARRYLATGGAEGIPCRKFGRSLRFPADELVAFAEGGEPSRDESASPPAHAGPGAPIVDAPIEADPSLEPIPVPVPVPPNGKRPPRHGAGRAPVHRLSPGASPMTYLMSRRTQRQDRQVPAGREGARSCWM